MQVGCGGRGDHTINLAIEMYCTVYCMQFIPGVFISKMRTAFHLPATVGHYNKTHLVLGFSF